MYTCAHTSMPLQCRTMCLALAQMGAVIYSYMLVCCLQASRSLELNTLLAHFRARQACATVNISPCNPQIVWRLSILFSSLLLLIAVFDFSRAPHCSVSHEKILLNIYRYVCMLVL